VLAYLSGTLKSIELLNSQSDLLVVEVHGVGFEVNVTRRTAATIGQIGGSVTVFTALSIKETEWTLFGFSSLEDRELFFLLQSVSGIGPKLALSLTGNFEAQNLAEAIINQDQKIITQCPGVGSKVAQRLILELKDKMNDWYQKRFAQKPAMAPVSQTTEEVRSILANLGYTNTEINLALIESRKANIEEDVETLVRHSLRTLGASALS
jgi:holliday junction DNA helicase RuvA